MMAAQTLEVVHCLVNNVKVVMNGARDSYLSRYRRSTELISE